MAEDGLRLWQNSYYHDPSHMNTFQKVITYGALAWAVFLAIMQVLLLFGKDPRETKEEKSQTESARMLLRHHNTNMNSSSSREKSDKEKEDKMDKTQATQTIASDRPMDYTQEP